MPLTDAEIRAFSPQNQRFRRSDGGGLFVDVMPSGKKVFRLAYRSGGKQRTVVIGEYPSIRLADARLNAAAFKSALRDGTDPKSVAKAEAEDTGKLSEPPAPLWETIASEYLMLRQRSGAAPRTMTKLDRQVGVTIRKLGQRPINQITAEDILAVVNPIAERGQVESAHEIRSRFSQIFRYAAARGLIDSDPAAYTIGAMVKRRRGEFAGVTDPAAIGQMMRAIHEYRERHMIVGSALLLSAYLFPRNTELRGMRWSELDWDRAMWEVPGERMKMKRDHLVPLPPLAVAVLRELREIDFGSALVFPSPRDPARMLSEMTFNAALRRMGYTQDVHVHHGFRTTASTNLNEMGWNADWIERQLAHVPTNKVRSSYNKAEYLDGRVEMMQSYADWLENLL
ncbi:integrase arm-type DNA-binding domain-containing protein [Maritimibacter sp. 55A14]|uniref:tyrosine-type recombinase/integrase n=1 Tax=Maritimibacter sp. 55A14 TaxID=2174844 RepID=UPI0011B20EEB|nr:integrase arm-type DNA-binding domain-containing protein [Maritimibacter sp. 55A14]